MNKHTDMTCARRIIQGYGKLFGQDEYLINCIWAVDLAIFFLQFEISHT